VKKLNIGDLNKIYTESEAADKEVYAEFKSNILLISGDHYNKKTSRVYNRIRSTAPDGSPDSQRLRLTKNHIHKVYRTYVANILSYAPGVAILPQIDSELQDQKDAELNNSVWQDAKNRYRLQEKTRQWCQDFVGIGEVACKIFFDPNRGELKGYEPKMMEDENGEPVLDESGQQCCETDESGQQVADEEKPVFKGEFVFERIFGFNLLRSPAAKSMEDSPYLIVRKMVDECELKERYEGDSDKMKAIQSGSDETYIVFDSNKGEYRSSKDQVLVKEFYWKPCFAYPEGYFAITTNHGILEEGPLPYGIFPIVWAGFDEYPTAPRGRSIVKQLRPFQGEINRAASQCAQHQITLGDDKLIYQGGTKLAPGTLLPGVRGISFNGVIPPTVLPGRDGSQYLPYIESQIKELYDVAELTEENEPAPGQIDAYSMLFTSLKRQRKFAIYGEKFEQFLIDLCQVYLELAKQYLDDDALIYAVGKSERINMAEFRKTSPLCYQIRLEARSETIETQLGKQLTANHILQYVGPQLQKDDIGKIIRNMPFGNNEESFKDFTIDYDVAKNDFLALERGEIPIVGEYDNHEFAVRKTTARIKEPDFRFLTPQIRVNYITYLKQHEKFIADQAQKLIDAKNEFIPISGPLIGCDFFVPTPTTRRHRSECACLDRQWLG
jgi:hypothetical protein